MDTSIRISVPLVTGEIPAMMPSRPAPMPPSRLDRTFPDSSSPPPPYQHSPPATSNTNMDRLAAPSVAPSVAPSATYKRRPSFSSFVSRATAFDKPLIHTTSTNGRSKTMLRKQKVRDQEELLRQQRILAQPPPQLHVPLIDGFGSQDRPDSLAIMSGKMYDEQVKILEQQPVQRAPVNNFSRPGYVNSSTSNNSLNKSYAQHGMRSSPSVRTTISATNRDSADPYSRTESMTNRGRECYTSSGLGAGAHANTPRRVRRRKDPTPFNVLIIGAQKSGKTSFVEFLKTSLALPASKRPKSEAPSVVEEVPHDAAFIPSYVETDVDGERIGLTLWDSQGLEKNIADLQLREITSFIESKFEETFLEEQKVIRSPGARDTHIHCVLLILDPARLDTAVAQLGTLNKEFSAITLAQASDQDVNLQAMRALSGKTTVVPIISKADTLTSPHLNSLKRSVWASIQAAKLDPLEAIGLEEDEEEQDDEEDGDSEEFSSEDVSSSDIDSSNMSPIRFKATRSANNIEHGDSSPTDRSRYYGSSTAETTPSPTEGGSLKPAPNAMKRRTISPMSGLNGMNGNEDIYIPFSILSPDPFTLPQTLKRIFPWGEADPLNPQHCDFARLRESVFGEWRDELRNASREKWYEGWRTSRLKRTPGGSIGSVRIRQAGGVTPARAMPREGRTSPASSRKTSAGDERLRVGSDSSKVERLLGSPRGLAI